MITRIRRKLADIRYHSAARENTIWARLGEWVLPVSVLIAAFIMFALETSVARIVPLHRYHGSLAMIDDGDLVAAVARSRDLIPPLPGRPFGDFTVSVVDERRGLLITTAMNDARVSIDLNLFDEVGMRLDARLPADAPERRAIADALGRRNLDLVLPGPVVGTSEFERVWSGTLLGTALWAVGLAIVGMIGLRLSRLLWLLRGAKRADRATVLLTKGRCHECGYDLTGLEFNARCPECGALVQ